MRLLLMIAPALLLAACGERVPRGVVEQRDLAYTEAGGHSLYLDLYRPAAGGPWPAILYFHQGGWHSGSKDAFEREAEYMAQRGFAGACVQYRLSSEAKYPAAIYDAKAAVRWLRANGARFGIDPERIGAAGASAGGYLALMLGVTAGNWRFERGVTGSAAVKAVAAFNPVLDVAGMGRAAPDIRQGFLFLFLGVSYRENPGLWEEATPAAYVSAQSAPTLVLHGTEDETIPYAQAAGILKAFAQAGAHAELFTAPGGKHGFLVEPEFRQAALQRMEQFFRKCL